MKFKLLAIFLLFISMTFFFFFKKDHKPVPEAFNQLIQEQHSLLHYEEAGYSPLGRAPVVDALLGDPFYMPTYAQIVSARLKAFAPQNNLYTLSSIAFTAGGIPITETGTFSFLPVVSIPETFLQQFGVAAFAIYSLWKAFIPIYRESEALLAIFSEEEKEWLRQNYKAFFFGKQESNEYDFFTTNSPMPFKFFQLSARLDLAKLATCAKKMGHLVDYLYQNQALFKAAAFQGIFRWEEEGLKLIISNQNGVIHREDADFFLEFGGNNTFYNNAGGTKGTRAASLLVSFQGNNTFIGNTFVQGSGFLGVGVLANFSGHNRYKAKSYSQGCGFFGTGILMDLGGGNSYEIDFAGQSCALFGSSLLWNKEGNSHYLAHEGMAQAASSTLGVAFLVDNKGNSRYISGVLGKKDSGIGQGGAMGVRFDPWIANPSFYGGVSFLYNGGGENKFQTSWLGQGSGYFLSAGILVDEGINDAFYAEVDSQGQGLHLAAGLLLKEGGNDTYYGGWGSLGAAGDRSIGMFIDTKGDDSYAATDYSIGSARKPQAIGVLIDLYGKNIFHYRNSSRAHVQKPQSPEEWPTAVFLSLGGNNVYPEKRQDEKKRTWKITRHRIDVDLNRDEPGLDEYLFSLFPAQPRVAFPFDPFTGWSSNTAYRPLIAIKNQNQLRKLIETVSISDYDHRRQIYESIDLLRFSHPEFDIDLSDLLKNPANISEDQLSYAALWSIQNDRAPYLDEMIQALEQGEIQSPYARKMAVMLIAILGVPETIDSVLAKIMQTDSSLEIRALATLSLAGLHTAKNLNLLKPALKNSHERIRYAAAKGLKDNYTAGVIELVIPLLRDPSFYVRRAAAMTAISHADKRGIPVLLETLKIDTLDTGENYGDNLFNTLSQYVGVNFGLNKEDWIQWWEQVQDSFEFPSSKIPKHDEIPAGHQEQRN